MLWSTIPYRELICDSWRDLAKMMIGYNLLWQWTKKPLSIHHHRLHFRLMRMQCNGYYRIMFGKCMMKS